MRGVVSLAAALALPAGFPERDIILFLAFCGILATLVLQGTTLGPLIRWLKLSEGESESLTPATTPEAINARGEATVAAMEAVSEKVEDPEQAAIAEELLRDLRKRAKRVDQMRQDAETGTQRTAMQMGLRLTAIEAARAKLLSEHRDELESDDMSLLIAELDLEEQQIRLAMGNRNA